MARPPTATLEHRPVAATAARPSRRVFVIDDDPVMLLSCRRILEKDGYEVETCSNGGEGIRRIAEVRPELLLVDLKMPELDGLQVIERVRAVDPDIVIAVITGYATIATAIDAMQAGAYDFLPKPFTPDELRLIVNRGHERWRLAAESARLRHEKEEAERRFITFVSHQLKSPVVAAKQYLDVLLFTSKDAMAPQTREWLARAQARLDEMLGLIHDWLELARLDRGERGAARHALPPLPDRRGRAHRGRRCRDAHRRELREPGGPVPRDRARRHRRIGRGVATTAGDRGPRLRSLCELLRAHDQRLVISGARRISSGGLLEARV